MKWNFVKNVSFMGGEFCAPENNVAAHVLHHQDHVNCLIHFDEKCKSYSKVFKIPGENTFVK